ncbi:MAG: ABC transporter transmembrane domain-containing protein [Bacilli bacterium]
MNNVEGLTKQILKESKKEIIDKVIISIINRGLLLVIPIIYSTLIDQTTLKNFDIVVYYIIALALFSILYYISDAINMIIFNKLYRKIYHKFVMKAYDSTMNNSLYSLSRFSLGEYSNILRDDVVVMSAYFSNFIMWMVKLAELIFIFGYFFIINKNIFISTLIIFILMIIYLKIGGKKTQIYNDDRKQKLDKNSAIVIETFNGIKEIKGFYIFEQIKQKIDKTCSEFLKSDSKYSNYGNNAKNVVLIWTEIVRIILVGYGIYLFSVGKMELGVILLIYTYYSKILDNFTILSTISVERKNLRVSQNRFNKLLIYQKTNELNYYPKKDYQGSIKFEEVLYGNKQDPILNCISFKIPSNSYTVITGKFGSGKTGIFDLLLKLNRQHNGKITIDDNEIELIDDLTYYNLISSVRKRPTFFDASIIENLQMVENNEEKIFEICRMLKIHDDILRLSDDYNTNINSKTEKISDQLKHMLAISRVLIKDSKIMLFDETISGLDNENQKNVLNILNNLKENHTIIIITREKEIMKKADKIIVVDENIIAEEGTYKSLMRKKGIYFNLFGVDIEL